MVGVPRNHRLAERVLIRFVRSGEWEVDADGRVWMLRKNDRPCERKRAEKRLNHGYLMVRRMIGGVRHVGLAHRLVWQHLFGDIPAGLVVNHLNGVKDDNRPENLEVVTYSGNMRHAYRHGLRDEHGEQNPAVKLSDAVVEAIRREYAAGGVTQVVLADRHGVKHQQVSRIVRGQRRAKQGGPIAPADLRIRDFPPGATA